MLDRLGLGNLMQIIFQIINGVILKEEHKSKHNFFKKRATDSYLQTFYSFIGNNEGLVN